MKTFLILYQLQLHRVNEWWDSCQI